MASLRDLPRVDALAASPRLAEYPTSVRTRAARSAVARLRSALSSGNDDVLSRAEDLAVEEAIALTTSSLGPLINATGVILHTGLGRARLALSAAEAVARIARSHAGVEIDLESGSRGDRQTHVRTLLKELTGAEDALVVNNCAAAVLLTLTALGPGEVALSRGEMIEIGGAFRMPDIVRAGGLDLREVGCTNKTRLSDYEAVINPATVALLRCHRSNFQISGFTDEPSREELAGLAREKGLWFIEDLGSGCLVDTTRFGLPKEPTPAQSIKGGAHLCLFSGDKLLGGPQAGLIVGDKAVVAKLAKHPMARAIRVDKLTLAALEATLRLYRNGRELEIPTLAALAATPDEVRLKATNLKDAWPGAELVEGVSEIGGGSMPGATIPTWRVGLSSSSPDELSRQLRKNGLVGRIQEDRVWLDPRTMTEEEVEDACQILIAMKSSDE